VKKLLFPSILFLLIMLLFIPITSYAASIGNPDTLGRSGAMAFGLEYDHSNTDMRLKTRSAFLVSSIGLLKNIDVFTGIGINKSTVEFDWSYPSDSEHDEIRDNSNIAWKVGARAQLMEVSGITLGGTVQYLSYDMDGSFRANGTDLSEIFGVPASYTSNTEIREWQAALTASAKVGSISPYVGVTYNKVTAEHSTTLNIASDGESMPLSASFNAEAKNEDNVGIVIGTGVALTKNIGANLEGRFVNETSGTASLSIAF